MVRSLLPLLAAWAVPALALAQATQPATVRLDELPTRTCAVVRQVETDDEDTQRLKTLGVCVRKGRSKALGGIFSSGVRNCMPAWLTRMSVAPGWASNASTA